MAPTNTTKPWLPIIWFSNYYIWGQPTYYLYYKLKPSHIVKYIYIPINYAHDKYVLLTIDTSKLKNTIQLEDIGTRISTRSLLERHYSYIHGAKTIPPDIYQ